MQNLKLIIDKARGNLMAMGNMNNMVAKELSDAMTKCKGQGVDEATLRTGLLTITIANFVNRIGMDNTIGLFSALPEQIRSGIFDKYIDANTNTPKPSVQPAMPQQQFAQQAQQFQQQQQQQQHQAPQQLMPQNTYQHGTMPQNFVTPNPGVMDQQQVYGNYQQPQAPAAPMDNRRRLPE
jgi:transcription initiation factor TFIID subunit TAF12